MTPPEPTTEPAQRRTPLVAHHGALGDTVHLTAMLQALAARWGRPCDVLVGPPVALRALAHLDFVGEVRHLGSRKRPYLTSPHQWELVRWLRGREASPCYVVERWRHPVRPASRLTRMEWLLRKAGVPAGRVVTTEGRPREPLEHAVDYQLRLARLDPPELAGGAPDRVPEPPPRPRLAVTAEEADDCRAWLGSRGWGGDPLVLFQAQARRSKKRGLWPLERWLAVMRGVLAELPEARVLVLGAPDEEEAARSLAEAAGHPRVGHAAAELPLRRLFALLTLAHSLVSLDTGPAQAAAALGCPVVFLAGTADPRRNRPLGPPDRVQGVTAYGEGPWPESPATWFREHRIEAIPEAAVLAAWRRLR